jgi:hypothetical protein
MTKRITAVDLDDALAELTPEARAEMQASAPAGWTALADQVAAASGQSVAWAEQAENKRVEDARRTDVDEWLRLSLLDVFIQWTDGRGKVCMHQPDYRRPQPVFSAAWRPGLVVCAACLHLLGVTGAADRTCDRCGRVVEGVDAGDPIYGGTVWLGALAYEFGCCGDCRPDLGEVSHSLLPCQQQQYDYPRNPTPPCYYAAVI